MEKHEKIPLKRMVTTTQKKISALNLTNFIKSITFNITTFSVSFLNEILFLR